MSRDVGDPTAAAVDLPEGVARITLRGRYGTLAALESVPGGAARGVAVLVPGFTGSKEDFLAVLPPLADAGYRVVAYDQVGQWESEGPDDPDAYTLHAFVDDLLAVIRQVEPDNPVHVMGHSFGGVVARAGPAAAPERFRSLALLASRPGVDSDERAFRRRQMLDAVISGGRDGLWQLMNSAPAADPLGARHHEFRRRRLLATREANLIGILRVHDCAQDGTGALAGSGVPLLVAYGTEDLWPPRSHAEFADRIGARQVVYPGAGHCPNEECPQQLCTDLVAFWAG
ncbi:alpha/beta hydrolase [Streptomyces sp. Li-HN-5-11]|uniref:alpha/beta fold hydrolase n=1 Tax=Streptomyces sp. Li-HN-5-11 TaxID=3075432 RepID=UPI0028AEFF40|nr:alpha/beta hydrolase [Streptomyces sp. Li-HN-5-11]WNM31973.1 alpha/beta hydrolase [Streptomyces sp. Li-HN-5-11]